MLRHLPRTPKLIWVSNFLLCSFHNLTKLLYENFVEDIIDLHFLKEDILARVYKRNSESTINITLYQKIILYFKKACIAFKIILMVTAFTIYAQFLKLTISNYI